LTDENKDKNDIIVRINGNFFKFFINKYFVVVII